MFPIDIHTHHQPGIPGQAILSCSPSEFSPQAGQYYSVGFHPWYLSTDSGEGWDRLNRIASHPQVLAVGEAGLDKMRGVDYSLQAIAFEKQILIAANVRKPLIIHAVKSYNEIINLKNTFHQINPWIIHGFRGKRELAAQLTHHDIYLSFGEKYQVEALQTVPLDKLFLETDDSEVDIHLLYEQAANHLSLSVSDLTAQVQQNINNVFFGGKSCSFG